MASQGTRANLVAGREESGGAQRARLHRRVQVGLKIGREGVGVDTPIPPGGAPGVGLPPEFAQILQMVLQAQAQFLAKAHALAPALAPALAVATIDRNYERITKMGGTKFEGTLDSEIAEK
ncbi:UNVERIFIED_CONTAM: hypothetical protein Sradi_6599900 [Sesamum radiatum]|uniref:Uncharacterized protein n=1 Tax=Sesamum radiatum TaxID=300843 RepID=A0AAW2JYA3_SESRA